MNKLLLFSILVATVFVAGCIGQPNDVDEAKSACINQCQATLAANQNLTDGPCLSNEIINDWVCDVAHNPRISEIDNKPENQCSAFRNGLARHFIEVDTTCNFIISY